MNMKTELVELNSAKNWNAAKKQLFNIPWKFASVCEQYYLSQFRIEIIFSNLYVGLCWWQLVQMSSRCLTSCKVNTSSAGIESYYVFQVFHIWTMRWGAKVPNTGFWTYIKSVSSPIPSDDRNQTHLFSPIADRFWVRWVFAWHCFRFFCLLMPFAFRGEQNVGSPNVMMEQVLKLPF